MRDLSGRGGRREPDAHRTGAAKTVQWLTYCVCEEREQWGGHVTRLEGGRRGLVQHLEEQQEDGAVVCGQGRPEEGWEGGEEVQETRAGGWARGRGGQVREQRVDDAEAAGRDTKGGAGRGQEREEGVDDQEDEAREGEGWGRGWGARPGWVAG